MKLRNHLSFPHGKLRIKIRSYFSLFSGTKVVVAVALGHYTYVPLINVCNFVRQDTTLLSVSDPFSVLMQCYANAGQIILHMKQRRASEGRAKDISPEHSKTAEF